MQKGDKNKMLGTEDVTNKKIGIEPNQPFFYPDLGATIFAPDRAAADMEAARRLSTKDVGDAETGV